QGPTVGRHRRLETKPLWPAQNGQELSMKKRILILEDDLRIATALSIRVEAAGYDVATANDGLEGLELALENPPDLMLMDVWMPVGIGFSVAQRLRDLGLG